MQVRLLGAAVIGFLTIGAADTPSSLIDVTVRPVVSDGVVTALDIREVVHRGSADGFSLKVPVVYPGAPGTADRIDGLTLADASGAVGWKAVDDPPVSGGFPYWRHYRPERPVSYPVTIAYRAMTVGGGGAGGPAFAMRAVGGGVAGNGATFLVLPGGDAKGLVRLDWDLTPLPAGSLASSSYGDGNHTFVGSYDSLRNSWYMAGPAGRIPFRQGFGAAWLGKPTFDVHAALDTAGRGYRYLARTFPNLRPAPDYRVYMQFREEPPFGGGTAMDQSFMLSTGPAKAGEQPKVPLSTIFHEMIHQWVGQIEGPMGVTSWFSEGLTSYYERQLPVRGGFIGLADYEKGINRVTEEYQTSKARNWSAAAIVKVGFAEEEVRHLPYRRSELYFHDLDAKIRQKSRGRRNLDSLIFPLLVARDRGGVPLTESGWIDAVTKELGSQEAERFRSLIIEGTATLEPRDDWFGPCFRPVAATFEHNGKPVSGTRWERSGRLNDAACRKTV